MGVLGNSEFEFSQWDSMHVRTTKLYNYHYPLIGLTAIAGVCSWWKHVSGWYWFEENILIFTFYETSTWLQVFVTEI